jgi:hypothetical protein
MTGSAASGSVPICLALDRGAERELRMVATSPAVKVKDYRGFTIYKSNSLKDPYFAEGKTGRGSTLAVGATLKEIEKKLDDLK